MPSDDHGREIWTESPAIARTYNICSFQFGREESVTMKSANFARLFRPPEEGTESDGGIGI